MHAMNHELEKMLQQLDKYLDEEKLTSKTISAYRASFRSLKKFAAEKKLCGYSNVIGDLFLQHRFGVTRYEKGYLPPSVAVAIRVVWMLSSLLANQKLKSIYHHNQPSIFPPYFQKVLCEYEEHYFYTQSQNVASRKNSGAIFHSCCPFCRVLSRRKKQRHANS